MKFSTKRTDLFFGPLRTFLFALMGLAAAVGCQSVKLPTVMNDNPSLDELSRAVNANSSKIQTLRSDNASLGVSNAASWANCKVLYQRPQNVRLVGTMNMMGRVVDFGSNDQIFWFWNKFQEPAQISWSPLNEYSGSPLKELIPVDPVWFPEALGVVEINSAEVVEGPTMQGDRTLLVVTTRKRPDGVYKKYTYIEPLTAAVKRQDIMDPAGNQVVSVLCSEFQIDQATGVVLPKKIQITAPKAEGMLQLDLGTLRVNSTEAMTAENFQMPSAEDIGAPQVNIGSSSVPLVAPSSGATGAPTGVPPVTQYTPSAPTAAPTSPPPMVAPASNAVVSNTPTSNTPTSNAAGTGSTAFGYPNRPSQEIAVANAPPLTASLSASGTAETPGMATAQFQTVVLPDANKPLDGSQSLFVPPLN